MPCIPESVRQCKNATTPRGTLQPLQIDTTPNAVRSVNFDSHALVNALWLKCLTGGDDFSHERVEITIDHGISRAYVARVVGQVACCRG